MKKILILLVAIFITIPNIGYANIGASWYATSTDIGGISPNRINGNDPFIKALRFISTSTTEASVFSKILGGSDGTSDLYLQATDNPSVPNYHGIHFLVGNSGVIEGMTVLAVNGNGDAIVGINNTAPTATLDINVLGSQIGVVTTNTNQPGIQGGGGFIGYNDLSTPTLAGDRLAFIGGGGAIDSSHTRFRPATINFVAAENFSATNQGGYIDFLTTPIGSTQVAGRTTRVRIADNGYVGVGSTTPGTMFAIGSSTSAINLDPYATSTYSQGVNIKAGCYAVNATCLSLASLGGSPYPFTLAGNATSTLTQFNGGLTSYASSTIGNGATTGGLTVSGNATTTGNAYFNANVGIQTKAPTAAIDINNGTFTVTNAGVVNGRVSFSNTEVIHSNNNSDFKAGSVKFSEINSKDIQLIPGTSGLVSIGSTTPWGYFSINANALAAGVPQFVVGSSTATNLIVSNGGNVGVGSTTPTAKFVVKGTGTGTGRSFAVSNSSNAENVTVLDNGNVGINNTSPGSRLTVNGSALFTMTNGASMSLQPEAGNFMRSYYGLAGNSVAVVFNRNETSADFYFGETADTGGMIFRGSGASSFEGKLSVSSNGLTAETSGGGRALVGIGLFGATPTHALDVVNNYITDGGDAYFDAKVTSAGGYDPAYVQYTPETRESLRGRVMKEIPAEKWDGPAQFWNKTTHRMEYYIASEDCYYDFITGKKLQNPSTTKEQDKKVFLQSEVDRLKARIASSTAKTSLTTPKDGKVLNDERRVTELMQEISK